MKIVLTLAIFHIFGNTPVINDLVIRVDKGMENVPWISFKTFVSMLFGPKLLWDDTHTTSMRTVQFSIPPTPLVHLRPKFF